MTFWDTEHTVIEKQRYIRLVKKKRLLSANRTSFDRSKRFGPNAKSCESDLRLTSSRFCYCID